MKPVENISKSSIGNALEWQSKANSQQPTANKVNAIDAKLWGVDLFGNPLTPASEGPLAKRFIVPPFSVLNARDGAWQDRKRAWINIGLKSADNGNGKLGHDETREGVLTDAERFEEYGYTGGKSAWGGASGSIFDPVLCELVFKWFCPPKGLILDPFGGESTKGIVATVLGHDYCGVEVRQEQVNANNTQAEAIGVKPVWICGDSMKADELLPQDLKADLIFTSPPYFDLEVYSSEAADSSNFRYYHRFIEWYQEVFRKFLAKLKRNRFLVVKIGEVRNERGIYRNFVGDNITCFKNLGLEYYNEIILVTAIGSLPVRAGKAFESSRKIGKTHQQVLVFWKGEVSAINPTVSQWGVETE